MSTSAPPPLSATTIAVILELICPPSQLCQPLPPHLLSPPLRQRHHFLHLSPDDPVSYLTWPSDSASHLHAFRLLETFQKPTDHLLYSTFPVRYSADSDSIFAHVAIHPDHPPGLRLLFLWDPSNGWTFHNLSLMPFPLDSFDTILETALFQPHDFLAESPMAPSHDDEGSYWDTYGQSDDSDYPPVPASAKDDSKNSEDAYWAQYASVHGSGDSTLPSPLPVKQKQDPADRVILAYQAQPSTVYNPLEPPSPNSLSRRLADIPPRPHSPPFIDDSDSGSGTDSPTPSPPSVATQLSADDPIPPTSPHSSAIPVIIDDINDRDSSQAALKDTIRSVYRLWKLSRSLTPDTEDQDYFIDIVRQVVAEPSST